MNIKIEQVLKAVRSYIDKQGSRKYEGLVSHAFEGFPKWLSTSGDTSVTVQAVNAFYYSGILGRDMEDIVVVLASIQYDIVSWFESSAGTDLRSMSQDDFERSIALIDNLDRRLQQVCKRCQVVFLFKWLHFCAPDLVPIADNLAWESWCDLIREVRRHGVQVPTDVAAVMANAWQTSAVFAFWRWLVTDLVSEDGWQAMKGAQEVAVLRSPLGLLDKLFWMRKHKGYNEMNNQPYEFEYHN